MIYRSLMSDNRRSYCQIISKHTGKYLFDNKFSISSGAASALLEWRRGRRDSDDAKPSSKHANFIIRQESGRAMERAINCHSLMIPGYHFIGPMASATMSHLELLYFNDVSLWHCAAFYWWGSICSIIFKSLAGQMSYDASLKRQLLSASIISHQASMK